MPPTNARSKFIHHPTFNTHKMPNEADINAAIAELEGPNPPTIADAAAKHDIHPSTLSRRFNSVTVSRADVTLNIHKNLTDA